MPMGCTYQERGCVTVILTAVMLLVILVRMKESVVRILFYLIQVLPIFELFH